MLLVPRYFALALVKLNFKQNICITEHPLFERYNQELTLREVLLDHFTYVLRMTQVQCRVDFIQDVEWCGFVF